MAKGYAVEGQLGSGHLAQRVLENITTRHPALRRAAEKAWAQAMEAKSRRERDRAAWKVVRQFSLKSAELSIAEVQTLTRLHNHFSKVDSRRMVKDAEGETDNLANRLRYAKQPRVPDQQANQVIYEVSQAAEALRLELIKALDAEGAEEAWQLWHKPETSGKAKSLLARELQPA